jgi:hypothetical protein
MHSRTTRALFGVLLVPFATKSLVKKGSAKNPASSAALRAKHLNIIYFLRVVRAQQPLD